MLAGRPYGYPQLWHEKSPEHPSSPLVRTRPAACRLRKHNTLKKVLLNNRDFFALVDDDDFDRVSRYRWTVKREYIYSKRVIPKTQQSLHRFVMRAQPGQIVDHINGNTFDNRKENLRFCTHQQNCLNRHTREEKAPLFKALQAKKSERKITTWKRRPDKDRPTAKGIFLAYEMPGGIVQLFPPGLNP